MNVYVPYRSFLQKYRAVYFLQRELTLSCDIPLSSSDILFSLAGFEREM